MPWGPVEKRLVRLLLDLMTILGSTRMFPHVRKYLGFGGRSRRDSEAQLFAMKPKPKVPSLEGTWIRTGERWKIQG